MFECSQQLLVHWCAHTNPCPTAAAAIAPPQQVGAYQNHVMRRIVHILLFPHSLDQQLHIYSGAADRQRLACTHGQPARPPLRHRSWKLACKVNCSKISTSPIHCRPAFRPYAYWNHWITADGRRLLLQGGIPCHRPCMAAWRNDLCYLFPINGSQPQYEVSHREQCSVALEHPHRIFSSVSVSASHLRCALQLPATQLIHGWQKDTQCVLQRLHQGRNPLGGATVGCT